MRTIRGILAATALLLTTPTFGHHGPVTSPALYYADKQVILEGELTEVFWHNPHVRFQLKVPESDGSYTLWELESAMTPNQGGGGLQAEDFPVGSQVKAAGVISRRNPHAIGLTNLLLPGNLEYVLRDRPMLWSDTPLERPREGGIARGAAVQEDQIAEDIFRTWGGVLPTDISETHNYDDRLTAVGADLKANYDPVTHPIMQCKPRGMPERMFAGGVEFVHEGDDIVMHQVWWDGDRVIHMNPDAANADRPAPSHIGYSWGHWEDDVLVVETDNVDYPFFDRQGTPMSQQVHFVERWKLLPEERKLDYTLVATDPVMFAEPVEIHTAYTWRPGSGPVEASYCANWDGTQE